MSNLHNHILNRSISRRALIASAGAASVWLGLGNYVAIAAPSDDLQAQLDSARSQLETMGTQLASLQSALSESSEAVEVTRSLITDIEGQIADTTEKLEEKRAGLSSRMRNAYKSGNNSTIDVLLGSSSIEELVSNVFYLDKLSAADSAAIEEVKTLGQELQDQKDSLETQQNEQQAQMEEIEASYSSYQTEVASAQEYYNSLDVQVQEAIAAEAAEAAAAAAQAEAESSEQSAATSNAIATVVTAVDNANNSSSDSNSNGGSGASDTAGGSSDSKNSNGNSNTETKTDLEPTPDPDNSSNNSSSDDSKSDSGSSDSGSSSSASNSSHYEIISAAEKYIGMPYMKWWQGTNYGPNAAGYDCCGLVATAYHDCGYSLPYATTVSGLISYVKSRGNWKSCDLSNYQSVLKPGDCIFCSTGHIAVYAGGNQMIHAPYLGSYVCYSTVYDCIGGGFGG